MSTSGKHEATGLPAHWRRGRLVAALVTLLVVAAATFALRNFGRADLLDRWWLQARFAVREDLNPPHPDPDIVLVEIDDRSIEKWPEPLIFWAPHFADAVDRLVKSDARVIAFDWMQAEPSGNWFKTQSRFLAPVFEQADAKLATALSPARNVVMIETLSQAAHGRERQWNRPPSQIMYSLPGSDPDPLLNIGFAQLPGDLVTTMSPLYQGERAGEDDVCFAGRIVERFLGGRSQIRDGEWMIPGQVSLPLREDNSFLLNYRDHTGVQSVEGRSAFRRYSLYDVATMPLKADERFRDKIVVIGATFTGSNDDHYVPLPGTNEGARLVPGMMVQANVARTLLSGQPIQEPDPLQLWIFTLAFGTLSILAFLRFNWVRAAIVAVLVAAAWMACSLALFVQASYALPLSLPLIGLAIGAAGMGSYRAFGEERERHQVMGLWGRYQDPRLVEYLLEHPKARGGEGQEAEVTVLFADLKNFTKTVEHLSPAEALQTLNHYLALMTNVIRDEYGGVVDKYLGDGLMAQWGAPQPWDPPQPGHDHASTAVRACLELARRTRELTQSMGVGSRTESGVTFGLRLTLHTGPVVVGWVGASRLEFTIIGDTVNVTSRLQETAKELGCEFLISEATYDRVKDWVKTGQQAEVVIRGRDQPLQVFEILTRDDSRQ